MSFDERTFRNVMGSFATGVTVVTTSNGKDGIIGLTANSFSSVSLNPPLVLWCLDKNSDRFDYFDQSKHFAINFLASDQIEISNAFAAKGTTTIPEHINHHPTESGGTVLDGVLAVIDCELEQKHDAGDHVIFVGRVCDLELSAQAQPLLFYQGEYKTLS